MWYVYNKKTTEIKKSVKTGVAAKAWITRKQKDFERNPDLYVGRFGPSRLGPMFDCCWAESEDFHKNIEGRNFFTGQKFEQPTDTQSL